MVCPRGSRLRLIASPAAFFLFFGVGKMIYYLNKGLIVEQALRDIFETYINRLQLDRVYSNFHISIVNEHPFARLIIDDTARASDKFPCIVITTNSDQKVPDMANMPPQTDAVGLTSKDLDEYINATKRIKTKIKSDGETELVQKNGEYVYEKIPGLVLTVDDQTVQKLKEIADGRKDDQIYGIRTRTRRRDRISVEIWSENNQLKNEIYEQLRILLAGTLDYELNERYKTFDICVFDNSINGERSSNYNFDFDVVLSGSHIAFEVDYNVESILIDTELNGIYKNIVTEVYNHVKGS